MTDERKPFSERRKAERRKHLEFRWRDRIDGSDWWRFEPPLKCDRRQSDRRKPFSERRKGERRKSSFGHRLDCPRHSGNVWCHCVGRRQGYDRRAERPASGSTPEYFTRHQHANGRFAEYCIDVCGICPPFDPRRNAIAKLREESSTGSVTGSGDLKGQQTFPEVGRDTGVEPFSPDSSSGANAERSLVSGHNAPVTTEPVGSAVPEASPSPQVPAAPSQADSSVGDGVVTTEFLDEAQSSLPAEGTATEHDAIPVRHTARRAPGTGDGAAPTADGLLPQEDIDKQFVGMQNEEYDVCEKCGTIIGIKEKKCGTSSASSIGASIAESVDSTSMDVAARVVSNSDSASHPPQPQYTQHARDCGYWTENVCTCSDPTESAPSRLSARKLGILCVHGGKAPSHGCACVNCEGVNLALAQSADLESKLEVANQQYAQLEADADSLRRDSVEIQQMNAELTGKLEAAELRLQQIMNAKQQETESQEG